MTTIRNPLSELTDGQPRVANFMSQPLVTYAFGASFNAMAGGVMGLIAGASPLGGVIFGVTSFVPAYLGTRVVSRICDKLNCPPDSMIAKVAKVAIPTIIGTGYGLAALYASGFALTTASIAAFIWTASIIPIATPEFGSLEKMASFFGVLFYDIFNPGSQANSNTPHSNIDPQVVNNAPDPDIAPETNPVTNPTPPVLDLSVPVTTIFQPTDYPHHITNSNKLFVYNQLVQGQSIDNAISFNKLSLSERGLQSLESQILFYARQPRVEMIDGVFRYNASTENAVHWTANFADSNLFGFCEGPLLAQDELQVLEHPSLAHIKNGLQEEDRRLHRYDTALFEHVTRLGSLDTSTPLANGHSLYGNYFAAASQAEIQSRLTRFSSPQQSNIFAIAAPHISRSLYNQPYQREDLKTLFFTFYNACHNIRGISHWGQTVVVHSGNWGAGAFGNDPKTVHLIQLAAARFARIDELRMYPLSNQTDFQAACQLLAQIENQFPQMTIGQFLDHLTANAETYNLRYKLGNGT